MRYRDAINGHDLAALLDCFDPDYESVQPLNPDRDFRGNEILRERWAATFRNVPDLSADLLRVAADADEVWAEWHWWGTRADRRPVDVRGITITSVRNAHILWGRLYLADSSAARAGGLLAGETN